MQDNEIEEDAMLIVQMNGTIEEYYPDILEDIMRVSLCMQGEWHHCALE